MPMHLFAALLLVPPEIPPPDPDRLAAAMRLLERRPISEARFDPAWRAATSYVATDALVRAGRAGDRDYNALQTALVQRIRDRTGAGQATARDQASACVARDLAYSLDAGQLAETVRFAATDAGGAFVDHHVALALRDCAKQAVEAQAAPFLATDARTITAGA